MEAATEQPSPRNELGARFDDGRPNTKQYSHFSFADHARTQVGDNYTNTTHHHHHGAPSERLDAIDRNVQEAADVAQAIRDQISDWQQSDKYHKIHQWLSPPDPSYNHNAARRKHEPMTGAWLLESEAYKRWKASRNSHIWLHGKAGCGKTVLCSTVIEDLRTLYDGSADTILIHYYCSFSDAQKQTYTGLLTSLVLQLCQLGRPRERLQQEYDRVYPNQPSTDLLEDIICFSAHHRDRVFLVVDALDEMRDDDDGRDAVFEWLHRAIPSIHNFNVFLTSRKIPEIEGKLADLEMKSLPISIASANADIRTYVSTQMFEHRKLREMTAEVKEKIHRVFEDKANGMFRWAYCQLEELKKLKSTRPKYVEEALLSLPKSLDGTYERMLCDIDEVYRAEALAALRWLSFGLCPLTLKELSEACLIDPSGDGFVDFDNRGSQEDLLDILGSLVTVEKSEAVFSQAIYGHDTPDSSARSSSGSPWHVSEVSMPSEGSLLVQKSWVRLAHFSVKEYLISARIQRGPAAAFSLQEARDQRHLAQSCVTYLIHYSKSPLKSSPTTSDVKLFPFLQYAAEQLPIYLGRTASAEPGHEFRLFQTEQYFRDWLEIYTPNNTDIVFVEPRDSFPALYYSSFIGLEAVTLSLLQRGMDINAMSRDRGTALTAASSTGKKMIVELLLRAGADVNVVGGYYGTALQAASIRGHRDIVELLIDNGADLSGKGVRYSDALRAASHEGHLEIVQLLIERGANVQATEAREWTALHYASSAGHMDIVELLLREGADVNAAATDNASVLHAVAHSRRTDIARLLISKGADVHALGGFYGTTLQAAAARGHWKMVELLVDEGVDVNAVGGWYGTALQAASCLQHSLAITGFGEDHEDIIKALIAKGADVNAVAGQYKTALKAARRVGSPQIVELLISLGALDDEVADTGYDRDVKLDERSDASTCLDSIA